MGALDRIVVRARHAAPAHHAYAPLLLSILMALGGGVRAQDVATAGTTRTPPAGVPGVVVVTGARQLQVMAAKQRVLRDRQYSASSCRFLDEDSMPDQMIVDSYIEDFGLADDMRDGDEAAAVTAATPTPRRRTLHSRAPGGSGGPSVKAMFGYGNTGYNNFINAAGDEYANPCSSADGRMTAGFGQILRNDTTLADAYAAYDARDYARAFQLFSEAWHKIGYDEAALMLARLYLNGMGMRRDSAQALHWLHEVVDGRFIVGAPRPPFDPKRPNAMTPKIAAAVLLGRMYERGVGVTADASAADKWYEKAAWFGFVPALDILGQRALKTGPGRDPAKALDDFKQAADEGYALAQYHLARMYYEADGVPRDLRMAGAYFDAAAHAGMPAAMFAAGRMFDLGEGVPADPKKALVYYKDAALHGDRDAQFALGTFFYNGGPIVQDRRIARDWFASAAAHGQPDAMFNLGVMTAAGDGGSKDPAVAYAWFRLAARAGHEGAAAALQSLEPTLTDEERRRADTALEPVLAKAQ